MKIVNFKAGFVCDVIGKKIDTSRANLDLAKVKHIESLNKFQIFSMRNVVMLGLFAKLYLMVGCQNPPENTTSTSQLKEPKEPKVLSFDERLETKPKIFLDYWDGMNPSEFRSVSTLLEEDGKIKKYGLSKDRCDYEVGENCGATLVPVFENQELKEIRLILYPDIYSGKCLYDLYRKKYVLPKLKTITVRDMRVKERNISKVDYTFFIKDDKGMIRQLPTEFVDRTTFNRSKPLTAYSESTVTSISSNPYHKVLQNDSNIHIV